MFSQYTEWKDLQALNLIGSYPWKLCIAPASCNKPWQPTIYNLLLHHFFLLGNWIVNFMSIILFQYAFYQIPYCLQNWIKHNYNWFRYLYFLARGDKRICMKWSRLLNKFTKNYNFLQLSHPLIIHFRRICMFVRQCD